MNPRPSTIEANAQPMNGARICHMTRYSSVDSSNVAAPSRYERVLMPQMNDDANVVSSVRTRYVRWTERAGTTAG